VREYVDRGVSGAKERRPQLDELMADAAKGRRDFQAVIVSKFDRFARSVEHLLKALKTFDELGIGFISDLRASTPRLRTGRWCCCEALRSRLRSGSKSF
jgi:DNA invertase Pin-like site-specific DNA recombinase